MGFPPAANPFTEHTTNLLQAGFPETFDFKKEQGKAQVGTPHKNMNLWLKSFLPGLQLCWVNISDSCFSGKLLCPCNGLGLFWGISPAGSGALEVLVPVFSGWPAGRGTSPPGYPQCGAVYQAEKALVSASLDSFQWGCQSPLS